MIVGGPSCARAVEKRAGSGWIPTRGRSSRSASQQTPTVGSRGDEPVRVLEAGVLERLELGRGGGEDALGVQLAGERRRARPVLGVDRVVDAHRVVQEREEEDHERVGPVERLREPEPVRADRAPVQLAVDVGADAGAARADFGEERFERDAGAMRRLRHTERVPLLEAILASTRARRATECFSVDSRDATRSPMTRRTCASQSCI